MTQQEIDLQIEVLRSTTQRLLKEGPEACRKYLEDAGILPKPTRPIVCTLPDVEGDKEMFEGDRYWTIEKNVEDSIATSGKVDESLIRRIPEFPYIIYAASKEKAEIEHKKIWERKEYWYVSNDWSVIRSLFGKEELAFGHEFRTEDEALQFIHQNKPVYPAAEFEKLKGLAEEVVKHWSHLIGSLSVQSLKTYLESLNKKP